MRRGKEPFDPKEIGSFKRAAAMSPEEFKQRSVPTASGALERKALEDCLGCVTAAETEGLHEIIEQLRGRDELTDALIDRVERRLMYVRNYAEHILAFPPSPASVEAGRIEELKRLADLAFPYREGTSYFDDETLRNRFIDLAVPYFISLPTAPEPEVTIPGTENMDARLAWLQDKAADMGYVLTPEPPHPDCPHAKEIGPPLARKIEQAWDVEPVPFNRADVAVRVLLASRPAAITEAAAYLARTVHRVVWDGLRADGRARDSGFQPWIYYNARQEDYRDVVREIAKLLATAPSPEAAAKTPGARWRVEGKPDPHDDRYDCDRAKLAGGKFTDDEVANAVFLNPDINTLTIAKDRIRWLSRQLQAACDRAAEISASWKRLEESGFPPEASGWPFQSICGALPGAIDAAIDCLIRQRNDLLAEVIKLRALAANGRPAAFLAWARDIFGAVAVLRGERLLRLIEEAIELVHADGMERVVLNRVADRVYSRDRGAVPAEIGQLQACVELYAESIGESSARLAEAEWQRVQGIPRAEWERRHSAKQAVGIALPATTSGEAT